MAERLPVTKIQRFSTHDGPGVRTTVFLKGCPLRCEWCHNPETQSVRQEVMVSSSLCVLCGSCAAVCAAHRVGEEHSFDRSVCTGCGRCADACPTGALERAAAEMSAEEILSAVMQDAVFYGESGGITLSGGEPMAHPAGTIALLRAAKDAGLHTAIETCGYFSPEYLPELAAVTDLFLWDCKDSDPVRHERYTGVSNVRILENLRALDALGAQIELRCILVKGVNLTDAYLAAIAETYHALHNCPGVTLLPYHAYGSSKARQLGREDNAHPAWIPAEEDMAHARDFLRDRNVPLLD